MSLTALPTHIAVSTLSPVNIHTLIPIDRADATVSTTFSCNLSYTPVTPKNIIPAYNLFLHRAIFYSLSFKAAEALSYCFFHSL